MSSFLEEVAAHLYKKHGAGISKLNIIFPSRRARLFFVEALSRVATQPIWQPKWLSVDELMSQAAGAECAERVRVIAELYKIYSTFHNETFDKFYFWGEILLSDFDMVDKYLINADELFSNISDIKELEADISYLTPEQLKIISFWSSLGSEADLSHEKRRFLKIWHSLAPIYHQFKTRLQSLGIYYTGMLHRRAVENIESGAYSFAGDSEYAIVGFNALSQCEKRVFMELKNLGHTDFFWDWDDYYSGQSEQEAGLFIRENLKLFPPSAITTHDSMSRDKSIEVVSTSSKILQCKYVANILEHLRASGEVIDKNTAIILTDENLLLPLLYSLPKSIGGVNVTMGYPLRETLAYTFIERLLELQKNGRTNNNGHTQFYHTDVVGLLSHPYILNQESGIKTEIQERRMIYINDEFLARTPLLKIIFSSCQEWRELSQYLCSAVSHISAENYTGEEAEQRDEFLNAIESHITTLANSIEMCEVDVSLPIYISLVRRHMQTLRLPFEGEPLEGVQVMGILETRNLDFRNIIVLSMSDDNFPGNRTTQPSYVPYSLRSAYGLPTPEEHEGVYAYYFYRLLQRAQKAWLVYSSHSDEKSSGEASRYISQLEFESHFTIKHTTVAVDVNLIQRQSYEVKKEGQTAQRLARFTRAENPVPLSPTALYRYIACPMRFYFYSIMGIKRDEELNEGVDAPMFGTILHAATQELYTPLQGIYNPTKMLREATKDIENIVERAIERHLLNGCEELSGSTLLIKDIVSRYIKDGIVAYDLSHPNFTVEGVEREVEYYIPLKNSARVKLCGVADRIDRMEDGTLRVVDYKTGAAHLEFKGVESLFKGDGHERMSNIIQTLLYSMMLSHATRESHVRPALYYVRGMHHKAYSPNLIDCTNKDMREPLCYDTYQYPFESLVRETLDELFDPNITFTQCKDKAKTCAYCDYRAVCGV